MRRVHKNLCPATISTSIMAANMWKNSLKGVESHNNKMLYETLLEFLQRNGTYFLNKLRSIKNYVNLLFKLGLIFVIDLMNSKTHVSRRINSVVSYFTFSLL